MRRYLYLIISIVLLVLTMFLLTSCENKNIKQEKGKTIDNPINMKESIPVNNVQDKEFEVQDEVVEKDQVIAEDESDSVEKEEHTGYDNYLVFLNHGNNRQLFLYVLNKETKECKQVFDKPIDSKIDFSKLKKKNYFISSHSLYLLDGDTLVVSLIKDMDEQGTSYNVVKDLIIYNKDNNAYIYDINKDNEKELLFNKENISAMYKNDFVYIYAHNPNQEVYKKFYYKYSLKTGEIEEIYNGPNNNFEMLGLINSNLYLEENYSHELYYLDNNELIQLKEYDNSTITKDDEEFTSSTDHLYKINRDSYSISSVIKHSEDIYIDDFMFVLTQDGNILKYNIDTLELVDILFWYKDMNNFNKQENYIKIQDDKMAFKNMLMEYYTRNEVEGTNIGDLYYHGFQEYKANFANPYKIKNNKTYLESEIKSILDGIGEEVKEYDFSEDRIAYVRSNDKKLVVIDRDTNDTIFITDYQVSNVKVYGDKVYYTRHDEEFGFYNYYNGESHLLDKIIVSNYCETGKNIYYNDAFLNKSWMIDKETLKKYKLNNKIDFMISEGDTLYFTEQKQLLYKKTDKDKKKLLSVIPAEGWDTEYFFMYDNNIYVGSTAQCYTRIFKFKKEFEKPIETIYEDNKCIIFPVFLTGYEECSEAVFVYDKSNQTINDIIYYYWAGNKTEITNDAIFISDNAFDFPKIHRIDLKSLETSVFYKSEYEPQGIGISLDFNIIGDDLIIIQNNSDWRTDSSTGMTLIKLSDPNVKRNIQSDKMLCKIDNCIYYKDTDASLKYIDFTNGFEANTTNLFNSVTDYIVSYDNYVILSNDRELISLNGNDNSIQHICNDFMDFVRLDDDDIYYENTNEELVKQNILSLEKKIIGQDFMSLIDIFNVDGEIVIIYNDRNNRLVRVDKDTSLLMDSRYYDYKNKNNRLLFTTETEDYKQITDVIYCYDVVEDNMIEIKNEKDMTNVDNINYFMSDDKIILEYFKKNGEKEEVSYSFEGELLGDNSIP